MKVGLNPFETLGEDEKTTLRKGRRQDRRSQTFLKLLPHHVSANVFVFSCHLPSRRYPGADCFLFCSNWLAGSGPSAQHIAALLNMDMPGV